MIGRESCEVFDLHVVAPSGRVGGALVIAMTGCSAAQDARVVVRRVVDPDDDTLPVMAVPANNVAGDGLVLGEVPSVHDGEFAPMPGGAGVDLALVRVATSSAHVTGVLKTTTTEMVSECSRFGCCVFWLTWCFQRRPPQCTAGSHERCGAKE